MSPLDSREPDVAAVADAADEPRVLRALDLVVREGVVVLSADGAVEYANAPARRLISDDAAVIGRFAREVRTRLEDADGTEPRLARMWTPGDGHQVLVHLRAIEGGAGGHVVVVQDADSADDLEEQLFLANRVRGMAELYLSMAHDLKTPVNAMGLTLDTLRESIESARPGDPAEQVELVDTVHDELGKLHRALQAFLSQTSPPAAARRRFDARRVAREVFRSVQPLAESRGVRLRLDTGPSPCAVRGYRERLEQAVRNVTVNGVEATGEDGEVCLRVRCDDDVVVLAVLDEGPGVNEGATEHLFKINTTGKPDGTGIGLFVARAAVVAHGGAIRLRNREGGGAAAEIRVPRAGDAS